MRVIYKAPGGKPEIRDIPNTLEELQASVGGYITAVSLVSISSVRFSLLASMVMSLRISIQRPWGF